VQHFDQIYSVYFKQARDALSRLPPWTRRHRTSPSSSTITSHSISWTTTSCTLCANIRKTRKKVKCAHKAGKRPFFSPFFPIVCQRLLNVAREKPCSKRCVEKRCDIHCEDLKHILNTLYIVTINFSIPLRHPFLLHPFFLQYYLSFPVSWLLSRFFFAFLSTRFFSYFFSLSLFFSFFLSLLCYGVVSWGQCLLDRILSRNIPVAKEEEEDDLSFTILQCATYFENRFFGVFFFFSRHATVT